MHIRCHITFSKTKHIVHLVELQLDIYVKQKMLALILVASIQTISLLELSQRIWLIARPTSAIIN